MFKYNNCTEVWVWNTVLKFEFEYRPCLSKTIICMVWVPRFDKQGLYSSVSSLLISIWIDVGCDVWFLNRFGLDWGSGVRAAGAGMEAAMNWLAVLCFLFLCGGLLHNAPVVILPLFPKCWWCHFYFIICRLGPTVLFRQDCLFSKTWINIFPRQAVFYIGIVFPKLLGLFCLIGFVTFFIVAPTDNLVKLELFCCCLNISTSKVY